MNEILVKAPAKLNLHLQVISKRSDEFHELRTLFTNIDLFDDLFFKITDEKVELKEKEPINDNLVLKAANILKQRTKFYYYFITPQQCNHHQSSYFMVNNHHSA